MFFRKIFFFWSLCGNSFWKAIYWVFEIGTTRMAFLKGESVLTVDKVFCISSPWGDWESELIHWLIICIWDSFGINWGVEEDVEGFWLDFWSCLSNSLLKIWVQVLIGSAWIGWIEEHESLELSGFLSFPLFLGFFLGEILW